MAHNVRTRDPWGDGNVPTQAEWQDFERKIFTGVNGVDGGAYECAAVVTLGGSGLVVTGPTRVLNGAKIACATGPVIANAEWPVLGAAHVGRSRKILTSALLAKTNPSYALAVNTTYASAQTIALAIDRWDEAITAPEMWIPIRVHDAATLDRVVYSFRVPQVSTDSRLLGRGIPSGMPKIRIVRVDASGVMTSLKSTTVDALGLKADADGFITPDLPTLTIEAQHLTFVCDQNNVVDIDTYVYWAHIVEEVPTDGAPSRITQVEDVRLCAITNKNLAATGSVSVDGVASVAGDRILLPLQTDTGENGIYIASAGLWTRAADRATGSQFVSGEIVYVADGLQHGATIRQLETAPFATSTVYGSASVSISTLNYIDVIPRGNIHHSVQAQFTNIADLRWQ